MSSWLEFYAWQWANKIGPAGKVEEGRPNTAEVIGNGRHFSVFHLPQGTTPDGVIDYLTRREAVGARVQMAEMSMDVLEKHVLHRDRSYKQLAQTHALHQAGHIGRIRPGDSAEITISTYLLDQALVVDLWNSQRLGGGIVDVKVPWRYVLLEDFGVFRGVELAPECWEDWRDLSLWFVQPVAARDADEMCDAVEFGAKRVEGWCLDPTDNGWPLSSWYGPPAPSTRRARTRRSRQMGFYDF